MKAITKLNLALSLTFAITASAAILYNAKLLEDHALKQITAQAQLLLTQINAVRAYTVREVRPLTMQTLDKGELFHPQSIPAYAANQVVDLFKKTEPDYSYKEAVFNPTNPRDNAAPWEENIINKFIKEPEKLEIIGTRIINSNKSLYIAKPIRITNPACLECHSTPEAAPRSMVAKYGSKNGFGWKLNEVVGTQMIIVPYSLTQKLASSTLNVFLLSLLGIYLTLIIIFNMTFRNAVSKKRKLFA